jgi:hypothetical protein
MDKITPEKSDDEQSTFSAIIDKITPDKKELKEGEEEQSTISSILDKLPSFDKKDTTKDDKPKD